jgi:23S rRNA (cytidine1920-2'-O)/16S rRNA (cytidine1409-2'-O)-methyltransferase
VTARRRLDQLLVDRGLAESREQARRLVRAGAVQVNGRPADKPGHAYPDDADVTVAEPERYVGRGGLKLEAALEHFGLEVGGRVALDVGASTGGFTDCLLQHGAARVYAVDVGAGQLHWRLRNDPRVVVLERTNARHLKPGLFDPAPTCAVIDVSFISLTKVLPAVTQVLAPGAHIVTLIKPQFEAGREQVGRGGVVRDPEVHREVIERIRAFGTGRLGLVWCGVCPSPIRGPAGNVEFLVCWDSA